MNIGKILNQSAKYVSVFEKTKDALKRINLSIIDGINSKKEEIKDIGQDVTILEDRKHKNDIIIENISKILGEN